MGGLLGGGKQTSTSQSSGSSTPVLPDYLKDIFPDIASRANTLSLENYTPYSGNMVAGLTPEQIQAFQGVSAMQGQQAGLQQNAQNLITAGSQDITSGDISQYMSPYMQNVVDMQKRGALRDFDIQMNGIGDAAANAGAFGGDRHGIVEANAYNDVNTRLSDIQTTGLQSAYTDASNLALNQQGNKLNAGTLMSQLAGANQSQNLTGLAALEQTGATQQAQNQAGLNWDYQQYAQEQQHPYDQLNFLGNLLYPMAGITTGSTYEGTQTTTSKSPSSGLGTAIGLGSMIAAPFTGGMSSLFSGMGGLGSLAGAATGTGGIASSLMSSSPRMGMLGLGGYNTGVTYKQGGQVKKYAKGGRVDTDKDLLKPISDYLSGIVTSNRDAAYRPSNTDSPLDKLLGYGKNGALGLGSFGAALGTIPVEALRAPSTDLQLLGNWLTSPSEAGDDVDVNLGDKNQNDAMYLLQQAAANEASGGKVGRASTPEFAKFFAENMNADELDPEMSKNVLAIADMMDKYRNEAISEAEPSTGAESAFAPEGLDTFTGESTTTPASESKQDNFWDFLQSPLWAFGAGTVANNGNIGAGAAYASEQMIAQQKMAQQAQQQALENQMALDRADSYRLQTEISRDNQKMNAELFPLKKQEIEAEVAYKKAQAAEKNDPLAATAAEILQKKIEQSAGMTITEEKLAKMKADSMREAQAVVSTKTPGAGLQNVQPSNTGFKFIGTE